MTCTTQDSRFYGKLEESLGGKEVVGLDGGRRHPPSLLEELNVSSGIVQDKRQFLTFTSASK